MDAEWVLSRWELDDLPPEDVPQLAVQALAEGCTANELALLATLTRPTRLDIEEHLPSLLNRIGAHRPSKTLALKVVIDDYARQVAQACIEPSFGAHKIWHLANRVYEEPQLFSQVAIYVGLASEWDDHPSARPEIAEQIIKEARQFVDAGGLKLDG